MRSLSFARLSIVFQSGVQALTDPLWVSLFSISVIQYSVIQYFNIVDCLLTWCSGYKTDPSQFENLTGIFLMVPLKCCWFFANLVFRLRLTLPHFEFPSTGNVTVSFVMSPAWERSSVEHINVWNIYTTHTIYEIYVIQTGAIYTIYNSEPGRPGP